MICQFLSPRTNLRTDVYGGILDNRARLLYEIVQAIRAAIPDERFIISVKLNAQDFVEGGFTLEESVRVAKSLEALHVDIIELSGGTYEGWGFHHTVRLQICMITLKQLRLIEDFFISLSSVKSASASFSLMLNTSVPS